MDGWAYLTRRANQRHSFIIAQSANRQRAAATTGSSGRPRAKILTDIELGHWLAAAIFQVEAVMKMLNRM
jgi:hypothetical protein